MRKIIYSFLIIFVVAAAGLVFAPRSAVAQTVLETVQQLQEEISALQSRINDLTIMLAADKQKDTGQEKKTDKSADKANKAKETPTVPVVPQQSAKPVTSATSSAGKAVPAAKPSLEAKPAPSTSQTKKADKSKKTPAVPAKSTVQTPSASVKTSEPVPDRNVQALNMVEKVLAKGATGDDVRGLQLLMAKFPDIYPQGLITGFFGSLSEKAVKKLQKKLEIKQTGVVAEKTKESLGALAVALGRRERPHISAISPADVSLGDKVTVKGSGFVFEKNYIFVKGRIVVKDAPSLDGSSLTFFLPLDLPCGSDEACPIKVVNKNGISNAKPIKLLPLPEEPPSEPEELPPPPAAPQITGLTPASGQISVEVTLNGSGFTATNNSINFGSAVNVVSGLASADGVSLKFNVPNVAGCQPVSSCAITVTNSRGTSNAINFTVAQAITPVVVTRPNGGEKFIQNSANLISWSGGTDAVRLALVEESATGADDPSGLLLGWIVAGAPPNSSLEWNAKEVCDVAMTVCAPVGSGNYKILSVSENTLGEVVIGANGNWDLSDQSFSILPASSLAVLSPNGGEKLVHGVSSVVSWEATTVLSQTVKINLLKGGVFYRTIADNVAQSSPTGNFLYSWTPAADIPVGSDYSLEIVDAQNAQTRDTSDAQFTIAVQSTLSLVKPNGGETWFKGFQGLIRWNAGNILSKAVNIDLKQGEVLVRRLAANVPQKFYSWETQTYTSGSGFNYTLTVPADIPDGADYSLVISDAADETVRDESDAKFSIVAIPDPVTVSGRLINHFSTAALANTRLYLDGGGRYMNTGSNGEFTVSTSTASLTNNTIFGSKISMPVGSWPSCYMNWRYDIFTNLNNPYWRDHVFDLLPDKTGVFNQGNVALGDVSMWPGTGVYLYTDSPTISGVSVNYPDSSYGGFQVLALNTDLQATVRDTATGKSYTAPSIKIPLENGCAVKALTFLGGAFKWEPYSVRTWAYISSMTVGTPVKVTLGASGGVAPYTWGLYYGSLPPGLVLDPTTGVLSGTPTTVGIYKFQIKISDANGVNGGSSVINVTVK